MNINVYYVNDKVKSLFTYRPIHLLKYYVSFPSDEGPIAYLSDEEHDRVIAFNPRDMRLLKVIKTAGSAPYPIDGAGPGHVYVSTRGSKSIDVISNKNLEIIRTISLSHHPRSVSYNKENGLALVSGRKTPVTSVIDTKTHQVVDTVGSDNITSPTGYGGSLATGHPFWLSTTQFLILDRANKKMDLYQLSENLGKHTIRLVNSQKVNTSIHHVLSVPNGKDGTDVMKEKTDVFYAIGEGSPAEGLSPAVIAFELSDGNVVHKKTLHMPTDKINVNEMGSHHANFHPDGIHIYLGSNEGYTYVINRNSMSIVKTIETGIGNGHTTMIPGKMLGISTNHDDTFFTVIDLNTHEKKAIIKLDGSASETAEKVNTRSFAKFGMQELIDLKSKRKTQGHTSSFDPMNDKYFYTSASDAGRIIEIDTERLSISREIDLKCGSYPIQGVFVW